MFGTLLIKFIFQAIPEESGLVAVAMAIMGLPLNWRKILFIGTVLGASVVVVRLLPLAFGIHTVVLAFLLVLFLRMTTGASISSAFKGAMYGILIMLAAEIVLTQVLLFATKMTIEQVASRQWLMVLFTLPHVMVLYLLTLLIDWKNRRNSLKTAAVKTRPL